MLDSETENSNESPEDDREDDQDDSTLSEVEYETDSDDDDQNDTNESEFVDSATMLTARSDDDRGGIATEVLLNTKSLDEAEDLVRDRDLEQRVFEVFEAGLCIRKFVDLAVPPLWFR